MVRQIILAGFVVFLPAGLGAQGRGAMPSHAVNVAPRAVMPAPHRITAFVRRDGTAFFAVANSWEKGTLHYISSQGLPRTITEDTLDLDATRQFNEQRGLSFRLPA